MNSGRLNFWRTCVLGAVLAFLAVRCASEKIQPTTEWTVPHEERWGIYSLDLNTQETKLIYSSPNRLTTLRINEAKDRFVFSQQIGGNSYDHEEIFTIRIDGEDLRRRTDNDLWDIYPAWSPDGTRIAFLSMGDSDLDLYIMNADGTQRELLYDSGFHDADIHWSGDQIVFTSQSRIWIMKEDGTNARPLTDPPRAGEWGNANLPFGDYDPRINPAGTRVIFSRMVDDASSHGNYDLFLVDVDGSDVTQLTSTGYSQGLSSWSHNGEKIVYIIAAVDDKGEYDMYAMNANGTDNRNITPDYFPPEFICQFAIFSPNDNGIYFLGEWWSAE